MVGFLAWYAKHLWSPEAILAAIRPYQGVLGVIRWFQLQPSTCVALNTGRPEEVRDLTLQFLNALGKAYRVTFRSDLLCMTVTRHTVADTPTLAEGRGRDGTPAGDLTRQPARSPR